MMQSKRWISLLLVVCLFLAMVPEASAKEDRAMGSAGVEPEQNNSLVTPQDRTDPPSAFGIDVSHHQGTIDWDTVATQIDFAIIRCGYGDDVTSQDDRQWHRNVQECIRLGIPFGVYIYSYALSESEAVSEANHVLRLLEGYQPSLPVYYDLEDASILESCSTDQILNITRTFCEMIEAAGYRAGVYANHNWWTTYLTSSEYDRWDRWIARYASAPGYGKDYTIWQYTSSGQISGISGNVDLNHWYGTFPPSGTGSGSPANLGDVFTAPILNKEHWKIIENSNGIVQTADEIGKSNQLWKFERQSDGSYKISSCLDGLCLDVADASGASGAKVWMVASNDTNAQRWYIYEESGGYVLKAKCTDCVLDLPNNDPANGNQLQMYTKNGTGAQIWAIYRGEECVMRGPNLSVSVGTSASGTRFTWDEVYGETEYDVKIWAGTLWEGDAYHIEWNTTSGYEIVLPAGTYQAYVDAANHFECKMSNVVTFTVSEGAYTISYHANGGSGAPSSQSKAHGTNLTLSTTVPTRFGYTFLGWSTSSSADTPSYYSGSTYSANASTTLYAVWGTPGEMSGNYCGFTRTAAINNGGAGVYYRFIPNADANYRIYGTGSVDSVVYLYDASGNQLAYNDDGGTDRQFLLEYSFTEAEEYYIYVKFYSSSQTGSLPFQVDKRYEIYFGPNGGTGAPPTQYKYGSETVTLSTTVPTREGYEFLGWATDKTATAAEYQPGDSYSRNASITLYAVWEANSYTISYNANGGTGAPASQTKTPGTALTLTTSQPTRFGYTFLGWSTSSTASSATYLPGGSFTTDASATLYAVWESAAVIPSNVTFSSLSASIPFSGGYRYFSFTPSFTGWIRFESTGSSDTLVYLYNASGAQIANDDDSGEGNNFMLTYSVAAGTTYYVKVKYYGSATGTISFSARRAYDITFHANGGSGAPGAQLKIQGSILTLSTTVPTRSGYTFLGWATSSTASAAEYQPGGSFGINANITLYAVWEPGCGNGHSYTYAVTQTPTVSAAGTLTGTCSICSGTTSVTLPKLSTTDYSYTVTKEATCTASGTDCYTWKTTTYGSYTFNVTIDPAGHTVEDGYCIHCGKPDGFIVASGWSGAVQWSLNPDGVLTVYGSGNMRNYGYSDSRPWESYAQQITAVVIRPGVTAVGECAFKGLTKLESVALPESGLNKIGEAAFYGCSALCSITIPEGIYTIWSYTFKNCTELREVNLPKSLIKIDQGTFENCTSLPYIYIPTNVEIIGSWSFKGCTGLVEADMQWADATKIREGAFKNCSALTEIILPGNIQTLGDSCFYGIGATSFTVPNTVTSIEAWCFARAYSLSAITFLGNAPTIGQGAFNKISLTAYYPIGNSTWNADIRLNYGGTVLWKAK